MIYTSYFAKVKSIAEKKPDTVFVSIAGKSPDWIEKSGTKLIRYGKLAPKWTWWSEWKRTFGDASESDESIMWYTEKYSETVLSRLNPKETAAELEKLAAGHDLCLLCWEAPDRFCHRQLISRWLNAVGVKCSEIEK